jgi:hypothetical protein
MMETYPNFNAYIAARVSELGRQPYSSRRFFERHAQQILFGIDSFPPTVERYAPYFRFLETADEYFPYTPTGATTQGRWMIYGIDLGDAVLRQVYHDTAARLLRLPLT